MNKEIVHRAGFTIRPIRPLNAHVWLIHVSKAGVVLELRITEKEYQKLIEWGSSSFMSKLILLHNRKIPPYEH